MQGSEGSSHHSLFPAYITSQLSRLTAQQTQRFGLDGLFVYPLRGFFDAQSGSSKLLKRLSTVYFNWKIPKFLQNLSNSKHFVIFSHFIFTSVLSILLRYSKILVYMHLVYRVLKVSVGLQD